MALSKTLMIASPSQRLSCMSAQCSSDSLQSKISSIPFSTAFGYVRFTAEMIVSIMGSVFWSSWIKPVSSLDISSRDCNNVSNPSNALRQRMRNSCCSVSLRLFRSNMLKQVSKAATGVFSWWEMSDTISFVLSFSARASSCSSWIWCPIASSWNFSLSCPTWSSVSGTASKWFSRNAIRICSSCSNRFRLSFASAFFR